MRSLWKPWFVYRPRQLARRVGRALAAPPAGLTAVTLPWGATLSVNAGETVGKSIWTTGVYDIAVSEVLFRLTPVGGQAIDAGANVGYMTSLLAAKAGPGGRVESFEPHPVVGQRLRDNVRHGAGPAVAAVGVHAVALSDAAGVARFVIPGDFAANEGIGHIAAGGGPAANEITVPTATLDDLFPDRRFDVMKIDVEGHEAAVLRGARGLLGRGAIRHVVFEDHAIAASEPARLLKAAGYTLLQLGWAMRGPVTAPLDAPRVCKDYEAASYLATLDAAGAAALLAPRGWRIYG